MMSLPSTYLGRALSGFIIALVIGVAVVAIYKTLWAFIRGVPLLALWGNASIFQVTIASAPFLLLALVDIRARRPWKVALILTITFWSFYAYVISRPYEGGGANIGLGILMMFSPLPIAGASLLSLRTSGRRWRR